MMKWVVKLTLIGLLTSCSAQWHLKKAVQKDPLILEKDTLVVMDTVVTPPVAITDTVTLKQHDTITLVKDRLKVEIVKVNDTITINAECASDTIVQTIEVPYEKIVYVKEKTLWQKIQSLAFYFALVLLALALLKRLIDKYLFNG
tara:strand:+ start:1824 stop:2258 length:435 start_codon:yes stop_codon:yes gene_type:complete